MINGKTYRKTLIFPMLFVIREVVIDNGKDLVLHIYQMSP